MRPQVETNTGIVEGIAAGTLNTFLGIPYAAAPISARRWRAPERMAPWTGVREARTFGASCPQTRGAGFVMRTQAQSEDCLFLNVWTTSLEAGAKQPVMVWIHGGGNLGGAGTEDAFDGACLAATNVVVVTFNYRLGAFGFLAHPDIGANFGVLDYVAALTWVRDNIAGFGGDPANVTVFGESAGAVAVRTLLSCPHAKGLFQRAVIQSAGFEAPAHVPGWSYERARDAAYAVINKLGGGDIEKARAAPTAALLAASMEFSGIVPKPGQVHTPANLVWMPAFDNDIVFADGFPGWAHGVPVMLGCLENEARYFIRPEGVYTQETFANMAHALAGDKAGAVLALAAREGWTPYQALDKLFTAVVWTEPALETMRRFAKLDRPLYYYHFARLSPGAIRTDELVKHSSEIRYVFGNLTDDGYYDAKDDEISALMRQAWTSFARDGAPKSSNGQAWPRYDANDPHIAWIEDDMSVRPFPVTDMMRIINSLRRPNPDQTPANP